MFISRDKKGYIFTARRAKGVYFKTITSPSSKTINMNHSNLKYLKHSNIFHLANLTDIMRVVIDVTIRS